MAERNYSIGNIQVIFRRSSLLLKILVTVLIVFSMAAMAALGWVRISIHDQTQQMMAEAATLERRNDMLKDRIQNIDAVQTIQSIATEELGLVTPGTVLIKPE